MILQKLQQMQAHVRALKKDTKAYNYDYTSGDKILSVIRPLMDNCKVLLCPEVTECTAERVEYSVWNKMTKVFDTKTEYLYRVVMRMTWIDTEDETKLEQQWVGVGMNSFDKGYGSALTYGERYYLLKFFHIATDSDDVDAISTKRDELLDSDGFAKTQAAKKKLLKAAGEFVPLSEEKYWQYVEAAAKGQEYKGKTMRQCYIEATKAGAEELKIFDADVALTKETI